MNESLNIFQALLIEGDVEQEAVDKILASIDTEKIDFDDITASNAYLCQLLDGFGLQNELVESVVSSFLTDQGLGLGEETLE